MDRTDLQRLSKDELIELVIQLQRPDKTSRTSSKPPSTDKKEKRENSRPGGRSPGMSRTIVGWPTIPMTSATTDQLIASYAAGLCRPDADMELIGEYDEIEIPPVKPYVVRHRRFACRWRALWRGALKLRRPLSPRRRHLGPRIHALRYIARAFKALSYERLRFMFRDAFGLIVSEGALSSSALIAGFKIEADKAKAILRQAKVVASDETGVRIEGTNSYHWVFHCKDAVVHQARLFALPPVSWQRR